MTYKERAEFWHTTRESIATLIRDIDCGTSHFNEMDDSHFFEHRIIAYGIIKKLIETYEDANEMYFRNKGIQDE